MAMVTETAEILTIAGKVFYGQNQARNLVTRSLATGRLAHAYLFRGPEGVGKQLFAKGLAAAVNCKESKGLNSCGVCPACIKFAADSHPDFVLVAPDKGVIKIGQIRELIKTLSFAPYEARMRVVLIEDVHTMRREAANSLLKTLEEPPENNLLILTADSAGNILQTIISRCQTIPFYALTIQETTEILQQQSREMDPGTATLLARLGEGSPGKALLFHRRNLVDICRQLITLLTDQDADGDKGVGRILQMAEAMAALKEDLPHLLGLVRLWIRDCLLGDFGFGIDQGFGTARKDWNKEQYFAKLQAVDRAEKELGRNCNRTLVCEVLLFQLNS
ncbi:MAG: DNA polymerase III subunit delta' [Desulfocapsa sp.]|nr:DNA polymerase III subunit delta' [Desulfocapsa sp.]